MCSYRAETDAVLVNAGVTWQPFSELALAELPQVADPGAWQLSEEDIQSRRDLRSPEHFICSIDPPGQLHSQASLCAVQATCWVKHLSIQQCMLATVQLHSIRGTTCGRVLNDSLIVYTTAGSSAHC